MADFRFDQDRRFSENCDAFLNAIEVENSEMASILRTNWDLLITVVRGGEKDLNARSEFNAAVTNALDSLVDSIDPKDSE